MEKEITDKIVYRELDAYEIQKFQRNRYPLLLIDFVEIAEAGFRARGYKNFSYNEWFFPVHFKEDPNVPGFVQMEAMEEMFLMTFLTLPGNEGLRTACIKVQSEFKKKIIPGDRLDIESELTSYKRGVVKGSSRGFVNGELACEAELMLAIPDIVKQFMPTNICSI